MAADRDRAQALQLAERALDLDPNDPRVHYTLGFMSLIWRQFDRAEHHLDLARAMNPNDAPIQITWAWAKACLGDAESGLPAAELAMRLNPHFPRFYLHYQSRILFLARRLGEAAALLARITTESPLDHPRDLAWRGAACGHLGRSEEARICAALFVEAMRKAWRGGPTADLSDYLAWLIHGSFLRRAEDEAYLREGLSLAGLPT